MSRDSLAEERSGWQAGCCEGLHLSVVVLGASGDLARKKTFPALQFLHANGFLPPAAAFLGYARSALTAADLRARLRPHLAGGEAGCDAEEFLKKVSYVEGDYESAEGFKKLAAALEALESGGGGGDGDCKGKGNDNDNDNSSNTISAGARPIGRLFYLALPPAVYGAVARRLKEHCAASVEGGAPPGSWTRLVVEKPFGRDLASSEALADELGALWPERSLYRIDHYLGKELLQSLFVMRFANALFAPMWCRASIASVQITFKEDFGTYGRGGYFDSSGIVRDVMQNHLLQVLALVACEKPLSLHPDDVRDAKTQVLRCLRPPALSDVVLGQYGAGGGQPGYSDDPSVPEGSQTPTFAAVALYIDNDRWAGVPFVLRAGKALSERKAEIRLQLRPPAHFIFPGDADAMRNEIVIRLQPDEAVYAKVVVKEPGLSMATRLSELDLDYQRRFPGVVIPDAYPRLLLEAIQGDQQHFVRRDELRAAWAAFDPLLKALDAQAGGGEGEDGEEGGEKTANKKPAAAGEKAPRIPVHAYPAGSRGPPEADALLARVGYVRPKEYHWRAAGAVERPERP